ncbi:MAG TPA: tRNA preQ1(34) S-adenosylmethionine ribosyltransferase-isomerase QueA [Caulobacteraceae bacterium]
MLLADFDFELPEDRIALRPATPRDAARLLVVSRQGDLDDCMVADLPSLVRPGDALVFNDTKVIAARLFGYRERAGLRVSLEATLLERKSPSAWKVLARPGRRLKVGDRLVFGESSDRACLLGRLEATVAGRDDDGQILEFDLSGPILDEAIAERGAMPLPPYIARHRSEDERDRRDYQTIYAEEAGSVAAPTAGLHFTGDLMDRLRAAGVSTHFVTLHVGGGTFLPVKTETLADHVMHPETGHVTLATADALNGVRARGGRIIAVGTTSLRLLESALNTEHQFGAFAGPTRLFITPGYEITAVDGLVTNFHLPKSTLFVLVCAFSGREVMGRAYAHAIEAGYRFHSYGDASLLWRP